MTENQKIIEQVIEQTKSMLENHWSDITDYRNGGEAIKVGFLHKLSYEGDERVVDTTISFGKRIKDQTINRIDIAQLNLDLAPSKKSRVRKSKVAMMPDAAETAGDEAA